MLINTLALLANPMSIEFYFLLICMGASFTDSDLPDIDNMVLLENTTPISQIKKSKIKGCRVD